TIHDYFWRWDTVLSLVVHHIAGDHWSASGIASRCTAGTALGRGGSANSGGPVAVALRAVAAQSRLQNLVERSGILV
ncbi:hypothetical protein, partial [Mycobacterium tuberculosis]|uniref:hypothetical protein n=1 Tax=Mycobacterium tuberculosis TaxID=1773 RepID=UPI00254DFB8E